MALAVGEQRKASPERLAERRAVLAVRPFIGRFARWQGRVAFLLARRASAGADAASRNTIDAQMDELAAEIAQVRSEFEAAVQQEPPHGRIDDVRQSYQRLLHLLDRSGRR